MKKFKIIKLFLISIISLIFSLVIFLFAYYSILEKRLNRIEERIPTASAKIAIKSNTLSKTEMKSQLNLIPVPQKVEFTGGNFVFPETLHYEIIDSLKESTFEFLKMIPGVVAKTGQNVENITFKFNGNLPTQGYLLDIRQNKISIEYSTKQGLYYSIVSLKVLKKNYGSVIPCVIIENYPDLTVRGLMLDISRDKVPTQKTLLEIAQLLADLKFNHFELYIEGFSFAYPSFKNFWQGKETPITGEEIKSLNEFCKAHFIDLVPNQNLFGHMTAWLATNEYKDLAECPDGYRMVGLMSMKATLDPSDPLCIELVSKMTDDLLPNFTSSYYNVNLDEPFELGKGKSKKLVEQKGEGEVYLEYAMKIHKIASSKNKKMMMWSDIMLKHPELISRIPKDVTLLDWGYESSYPFERHCKMLQTSGLKYMVCPGTNSWASITGRTENMFSTIKSATSSGTKYGAEGMLLTDWGDLGHWHYLPVSYAGYVTGAALSWNNKSSDELPLSNFLSSYVFSDESGSMGDLVLDLGRYSQFEEMPLINMTTTFMSFQFGLSDRLIVNSVMDKMMESLNSVMKDIAPEMISAFWEKYNARHSFDFNGLDSFINSKEILINKVKISSDESLLIKNEYLNAIRLLKLGSALQKYVHNRNKLDLLDEKEQLVEMKVLCKQYLDENKRLWLIRNKQGGYERSVAALYKLQEQINNRILQLEKPYLVRSLSSFLDKLFTAGVILFIKLS